MGFLFRKVIEPLIKAADAIYITEYFKKPFENFFGITTVSNSICFSANSIDLIDDARERKRVPYGL